MNSIKKVFQYGEYQVVLETDHIARQASGAVMVSMGDTVVLVTVVGVREAKKEVDFFPLTVNYQERTYSAGKIPGGFFKREGRPTERETLVSRLIDRPLRPMFPDGFKNEVQIIATVLSIDPHINSDIPAIFGASAALAISGIPFNGPVGAARVGYREGEFLLNPSPSQVDKSNLDLVVAGTETSVLMVESEAMELSEEVMLGAVLFGHQQMQTVIKAIQELADEVGVTGWDWQAPQVDENLAAKVKEIALAKLEDAYRIQEKLARSARINEVHEEVVNAIVNEETNEPKTEDVRKILVNIEKTILRGKITAGELRIDGRDTRTVRPINVEVGLLPRTHGSALFTRGETQALVVATLGTGRDAQIVDSLTGEGRDTFMLHYNFPPYCVGETGMMLSPKRREIGHGRLAKRAIIAVLPDMDDFPYVMRVVSEITESNGSSSMASVCGASLALMDAGVPIKAPVAGIAMGLIKEADKFAVLSDILGDEDHLGDMDFKVAGTEMGVTALQMDIKIDGITKQIMEAALAQAREGRMHILNVMKAAIAEPRTQLSMHAPRITVIKINPEKIRDVIGKGGATIREITETTGATIDIADDGAVKIAAVDGKAAEQALEWVKRLTADVEVGKVYEGTVTRIMDFGAFVEILPGKSGLVHISQICQERIKSVADKLFQGQTVKVKVTEIDRQGRIRLSMKDIESIEV